MSQQQIEEAIDEYLAENPTSKKVMNRGILQKILIDEGQMEQAWCILNNLRQRLIGAPSPEADYQPTKTKLTEC